MPSATRESDPEVRSCWEVDHWLRHCEGYRVWEATGPIGYVEAVLTAKDGQLHSLIVRVGSTFSVLVTYPVVTVEGLDPATERVFVGSTVSATEPEGRQLRIPALA